MQPLGPETPFLRAAPELTRLPPLQQHPGKVRLVKDVLRVGRWYVGPDAAGQPQYWDVTAETLETIVANWQGQLAAGITHPLAWGHKAPLEPDVREADNIEDIAHLWAEDGTLWFGVYVTEEQAAEITRKHRQVSIGAQLNWRDGTGEVWDGPSLMHVAIVPHGTVPKQHSFIQMATGGPSQLPPKGNSMTFDVLKAGLDRLLNRIKPGATLPEEVTEDNFDETFPIFVGAIVGDDSEEPEPAADPVDPPADIEMSAVRSELAELSRLVKGLVGDKAKAAEDAFRSRVSELGKAGVPAADANEMLQLGAKLGWNQSCIDLYCRSNPTLLQLGAKTGGHASAAPPKVDGGLTPEDIAAAKAEMAKVRRRKQK